MFILGIVSLLQILVLPGFLATRAFRIKGFLTVCIFTFALSLIINHLLVILLTLIGFYQSLFLYGLVVLECLLLLVSVRQRKSHTVEYIIDRSALSWIVRRDPETKSSGLLPTLRIYIRLATFLIALLTVLSYIGYAIHDFGNIFSSWDAVGSWNKWAVEWSRNRLPHTFGDYPQLIPTTYSITYVFIGTSSIQFFAKATTPLFPLAIVLAIFDIALSQKIFAYFISTIAAGILILELNAYPTENMLASGYADIPVSCFSFLSFYSLLLARHDKHGMARTYLVLGAITSAEAALTKQTGLYMALVYPILVYVLIMRKQNRFDKQQSVKLLLFILSIIILLVSPWYVYKHIQIELGQVEGNLRYLVEDLHGDKTLLERFTFALESLERQLGGMNILLCIAFMTVLSAIKLTYKWVLLLVTIPFTFIWAIGFSYDLRNLAIAVPFIGVAIGITTGILLSYFNQLALYTINIISKIESVIKSKSDDNPHFRIVCRKRIKFGIIVGTIALVYILNIKFTNTYLHDRQVQLQKQIGDAPLNVYLYNYHSKHPVEGLIATHYAHLQFLPGFESKAIGLNMSDYSGYIDLCEGNDIKYFLIPSWLHSVYNPKIIADVRDKIARGEFQCLYDENNWIYAKKLTAKEREYAKIMHTLEDMVKQQLFHKAIEILDTIDIEKLSDPGRAYYLYAFSLHYSFQDLDKAIDCYDKALENGSDEYWVRFNRGQLYRLMGNLKSALTDFQRAKEINPDNDELNDLFEKINSEEKG